MKQHFFRFLSISLCLSIIFMSSLSKAETNTIWYCEKCNATRTTEYCPVCGTQRPATSSDWICPTCGKRIQAGYLYCPDDGTKYGTDSFSFSHSFSFNSTVTKEMYTGPGVNYLRAANGNAKAISQTFKYAGRVGDWIFIRCMDRGGIRYGYINGKEYSRLIELPELHFVPTDAIITQNISLWDSEFIDSIGPVVSLSRGTFVKYLSTFIDGQASVAYIETDINGQKARGFVSFADIIVDDGGKDLLGELSKIPVNKPKSKKQRNAANNKPNNGTTIDQDCYYCDSHYLTVTDRIVDYYQEDASGHFVVHEITWTCPKCNATWSDRSEWYDFRAHSYGTNNVCTLCGYKK